MARMLQMTTIGTRTKRMTVMDDLYCEYQLDILGLWYGMVYCGRYGLVIEGVGGGKMLLGWE